MTDLTPTFKEILTIFDEDNLKNGKSQRRTIQTSIDINVKKYELKDSFVKECYELLNFMRELRKILISIKTDYYNEDDLNMTEEQKDDFDTEFRLQFQKYIQKFKSLEKYETERQALIEKTIINPNSNVMNMFKGKNGDHNILIEFHKSNDRFRTGVLQSLNIFITAISSEFASMQQRRLTQQRKFEMFDLNDNLGLNDSPMMSHEQLTTPTVGSENQAPSDVTVEEPLSITVSHSAVENVQQEVKQYEETMSKLSQEQIQLLETEHEELLSEKNEQLKAVEKINKTILDIVSIQNELSTHLQSQSQDINTMLDNQDEIDINIKKGNTQLKKAKKSASRTANMTKYLAILIGILILLIDFIN
ncbi:similar to Saccharomyces cerevisiae YOR075W UFE1 t-SNARE required for retrograde vesicular traffic and homotypic ER membrane fusion [Maudiozyma barnettii]|uniref:Similar to Saccharomyces cerevisiae YOR075W UFE1 t-SNARE required for retrograde vesicular traffic and homotypic ER membrane fusion n=1 Tax=Maudiozyma barnettii TaxID=61262 RepID=A0A8H2ZIZ9_9SACH|nr:Ufe1p [Kazachstania barnettii]CAB4256037.1 similar to Saccharomyces cerevisiae YOR075W UFE1 t-SNARE required for retrograde vesicular traffic and homotypic ER membrane fusion [Kazachstania barnettii]CAD1784645.1 similar to Saccharomyces cerevisiae YOR075W UFE1 t-SNARE required for retrograde vesicular traffic and homotypic ER membrane fusion [Kazachstania barnettii]